MKLLWCAALLAASSVQAGDLLPTSGVQSPHMQQAIDNILRPAVISADSAIQVEPIIDALDIDGRAKRLLWGPLAGGSLVSLRVRIIDRGIETEQTFTQRRGAWHGTFRPGQDLEMLNSVAAQAAQFVQSYGLINR